ELSSRGVPYDGFNVEADIPPGFRLVVPCRQGLVFGRLVYGLDRRRDEVGYLAEKVLIPAKLPGSIGGGPLRGLGCEVFGHCLREGLTGGLGSPRAEHRERVASL